jgi:quercetin dioxygenase-like cupin family protein
MAGNFWTLSEIVERARSGEIESKELGIKWSYLNYGEHCTLNCLNVSKPEGIPLHTHEEHDEIVQVLDGDCEAVIGKEHRLFKKGGTFFVPRGVPHKVSNVCTLLSIYSPSFDPQKPDRVFVKES